MSGGNTTGRPSARGHITLVLGGTRSGKSAVAEALAGSAAPHVVYLATGPDETSPADADLVERVNRHRARRPATWSTVECGPRLVDALAAANDSVVLIDSLGTWLAAHHDFRADVAALIDALARRSAPTVIVSEEVGMSIHAPTALGRAFVDALGLLNQQVATIAAAVGLVVAGRTLWMPGAEAGPR